MKFKVEIEFDDEVSPLTAGLRVNWVNGENDKSKVNLSCGAGTGSPFMIFSFTDKATKKTRYAVADIRPVVNDLADWFEPIPYKLTRKGRRGRPSRKAGGAAT